MVCLVVSKTCKEMAAPPTKHFSKEKADNCSSEHLIGPDGGRTLFLSFRRFESNDYSPTLDEHLSDA